MTQQPSELHLPSGIDAGVQIAQLRHVLGLVEQMAGRIQWPGASDAALDESARLSVAYADAMPVVQKRFDALARETAGWAAAAVEALVPADGRASSEAAAMLADKLDRAIGMLVRLLPRG